MYDHSKILNSPCAVFEASPPVPPSVAQKLMIIRDNRSTDNSFYVSLKHLIGNLDFDLLLISYGLNIGAFYAYSTLLNQLIVEKFPVSHLIH